MSNPIDQRIAKLKAEIEQLEGKKKKQAYVPVEKLAQKSVQERFNAIREQALAYWTALGTDEHRDDNDHYVFESALEMCLAEETDQEGLEAFWEAVRAKQD